MGMSRQAMKIQEKSLKGFCWRNKSKKKKFHSLWLPTAQCSRKGKTMVGLSRTGCRTQRGAEVDVGVRVGRCLWDPCAGYMMLCFNHNPQNSQHKELALLWTRPSSRSISTLAPHLQLMLHSHSYWRQGKSWIELGLRTICQLLYLLIKFLKIWNYSKNTVYPLSKDPRKQTA